MATLTEAEIADLQAQRAALIKARNTGARQVMHGDKMTIFRSLDEMNATIRSIDADLAAAGVTVPRRIRQVRVTTSRGL